MTLSIASRARLLPRALSAAAVSLVLLLSGTASAQAPDAGNGKSEWPHAFPIWGDKLAERGLKFPLPWGLGVNYAYADQPINIDRIAIGVNDSEMVDISELIQFDELNSRVHVVNARVDLWLLPFMNVYGMANYIAESETAVSIAEPISFNAGATQKGAGGGLGMTFAGGAWGFFGTLDMNWTWNKMEKLDKPVGTFILTPRVGKNFGEIFGVESILWVGAMRQKLQSKTSGEIRLSDAIGGDGSDFEQKIGDWYEGLPPARQAIVRGIAGRIGGGGDPVIRYDLDKAVAQKWNMTVGGELGITDAWRVRAEVGFLTRFQVIVGMNYRFGDFMARSSKKLPAEPKTTAAPSPKAEATTAPLAAAAPVAAVTPAAATATPTTEEAKTEEAAPEPQSEPEAGSEAEAAPAADEASEAEEAPASEAKPKPESDAPSASDAKTETN